MRTTLLVVLIVTLWMPFAGEVMSGERRQSAVSTEAPVAAQLAAHGAPQAVSQVVSGGTADTASPPAPQAWIADYRIEDAQGVRAMTMIRTDDVVEVRIEGAPIHVWRRLADGVELREVDLVARTLTVYAPGDLRAMRHAPDWSDLVLPRSAPGQRLTLRGERQSVADIAFTDLSNLREIDAIDEGD